MMEKILVALISKIRADIEIMAMLTYSAHRSLFLLGFPFGSSVFIFFFLSISSDATVTERSLARLHTKTGISYAEDSVTGP